MSSNKTAVVLHPLSITNQHVTARVFWMLTFAILTAVGAQLEIPHSPVPFTAQTFIVLLAGAFLGPWVGAGSMIVYLALGALGMPVFSGFSFGFMRLLGPTGGYLLAFPAAAMIVGFITSRRTSFFATLGAMVLALLAIFLMGTIQLWAVAIRDFNGAVSAGFLIFSWWDALKLVAAASIASQYFKRLHSEA